MFEILLALFILSIIIYNVTYWAILYFYDAKYNKLGSAKYKFFILSKDYKILDNDKNVDYIIGGKYFSLFNNYSMKVLDNSSVDSIDAIFYTVIEDSIIDSKSSKSGGSLKNLRVKNLNDNLFTYFNIKGYSKILYLFIY